MHKLYIFFSNINDRWNNLWRETETAPTSPTVVSAASGSNAMQRRVWFLTARGLLCLLMATKEAAGRIRKCTGWYFPLGLK